MNLTNLADALAQKSVDSSGGYGNFTARNRSLNVSPQSYYQLLGAMNQLKQGYNNDGDRTEETDPPSQDEMTGTDMRTISYNY